MWKRLKQYLKITDALLNEYGESVNWELHIQEHLNQIHFFQHERAIHLAVTLAFGFFALMCSLSIGIIGEMWVCLLLFILLVLLLPYIVHYYHLENGVQKLYLQYDCMVERIRSGTVAKLEKDILPFK